MVPKSMAAAGLGALFLLASGVRTAAEEGGGGSGAPAPQRPPGETSATSGENPEGPPSIFSQANPLNWYGPRPDSNGGAVVTSQGNSAAVGLTGGVLQTGRHVAPTPNQQAMQNAIEIAVRNPDGSGGQTAQEQPAVLAGPIPALEARPVEVAALAPAQMAYRENSHDALANMVIGTDHMWKGEHDKAMPFFKTAIDNGREDPRTLTFASLSALNSGDPASAASWSAKALEKDPNGALAKQAEAINKLALKRLPAEEDPLKDPRRPAGAGAAAAGGSIPELERPLPTMAADPNLPPEVAAVVAETNRLMAQASKAYRAGDIKEAERLASAALAKDPDDVRAYQVRAAAAAKAGRWEEARKDAARGLDLAPGYVPLLLLRAAAGAHAKDWRAVKADSEAVLAKERANPTAWRLMGLAQSGLGARAEASASLSRAAQYGDAEAARLLAAARALPAGSDAVDLMELLSRSAEGNEAAAAGPPGPAPRRNKVALVLGAALLAGVSAGGLILLVGRRGEESA